MSNATTGKEVERLIEDSIAHQPDIIEKLRIKFKINSDLKNTSGAGVHGEKSDVRVNFECGRYLDLNIKGFSGNSGFNQLTRASISNFSERFDISDFDKNELEELVINKSRNVTLPLFPADKVEKWRTFFNAKANDIIKWSFSYKSSREALVLVNKTSREVHLYMMADVLRHLRKDIVFTKGGVNIGNCVSFQRKGGNGAHAAHIDKHTIQHPGNNIQIKLRCKKFISSFESYLLGKYFY